jgi:hypothetical protein
MVSPIDLVAGPRIHLKSFVAVFLGNARPSLNTNMIPHRRIREALTVPSVVNLLLRSISLSQTAAIALTRRRRVSRLRSLQSGLFLRRPGSLGRKQQVKNFEWGEGLAYLLRRRDFSPFHAASSRRIELRRYAEAAL